MDGYLIGEMLFEGVTVYTPWVPRRANAGVFAVDVIGVSGVTMTVDVETKKADASDDVANIGTVGTISSISATGVSASSLLEDFEDLYRYKISTGVTPSLDWIWFRLLAPSWAR